MIETEASWPSTPRTPAGRYLALLTLGFLVFWPGLDNGFISDDYVTLERAGVLAGQPLYLFEIPPENFRTTLYLVFLFLKTAVGGQPWVFYLFALGLHALNALLLSMLVERLQGDRATGFLAGALFVVLENPQEALLWLNGMHESLQGVFVLATALLWLEGRWKWSLLTFALALFSKESAVLIVVLVPLAVTWREGRFRWRREYLWLALPAGLFAVLFLVLRSSNSLLAGGYYAFGWGAAWVFVRSFHRIAFPWLYLALGLAWREFRRSPLGDVTMPLLWMAVSLLPYIFLTYQTRVPSRHQYLACMGAAAAMAILFGSLRNRKLAVAVLAAYLIVNAGYVWSVKDHQFELRAAPTERLLAYLRAHPPAPLLILDYPYNFWTAKLTTRWVEGWTPELIRESDCRECPKLRWDSESGEYRIEQE